MSELYKYFGRDFKPCDFSEEARMELYLSESYGDPVKPDNGFLIGKRWLNVTVAMWKEDIPKGLLSKSELYNDPNLPDWWLDGVFK